MDATHINLHKVVGPMLIGTWLDLMLFALVIDRALYYFHHYYTDRMLAKITVFAALACDMATVISECADVYLNTVTFQGNTGAIQSRQWPRSLDLASTGFSASIVQAFMLHRYWTLTRRKVLTSAVGLVMLSSLASTLYLTTIVIVFQSQGDVLRTKMLPAVILWLSTAMVADLLIAILLVLYYRATDRNRTLRSSSQLVRRLATLALKTGSVTALIAVITLVAFVADIQSNFSLISGYCIGRIYSLTLLYNLNIRRKLITKATTVRSRSIPYLESRVTVPVVSKGADIPNVESRLQRGRVVTASISREIWLRTGQ